MLPIGIGKRDVHREEEAPFDEDARRPRHEFRGSVASVNVTAKDRT